MSRVLSLFLAFALLFQMSWAVAATYCEHETTSETSMHFGHHVHVHKSVDGKKHVASKLVVDDDCGNCHAGHAAIIPAPFKGVVAIASDSATFPQPSMHGSTPGRAPDRPQWLRLA
jgi:cytochrome c5